MVAKPSAPLKEGLENCASVRVLGGRVLRASLPTSEIGRSIPTLNRIECVSWVVEIQKTKVDTDEVYEVR